MLTDRTVEDRIEAVLGADGFYRIQVRRARIIEEDGVEIARQFHREVLDMDTNLAPRAAIVRNIANAVWTPEERQRWARRPRP